MRHLLLHLPASLSLLCLSYALAHPSEARQDDGEKFYRFFSRPDIEAARWKVEIYDRERLAPGYWFVSPYEKNGYKQPGGSWIGPHIYTDDGELVWSGSHLFDRINVMDFRVQKVGKEELLTMLYAVEGKAYLLDHAYQVNDTVFVGETGVTFNMHDFNTVEDGNKFLYLQRNVTEASREMSMDELGFDGMCSVTFPGFEERDVETKKLLFKWDATGIIPFSDSTMNAASVTNRCRGWDYLHSNSIDKFNDGHYLLSTRHSDTLYKISKDDGSIIWRLHGTIPERSNFSLQDVSFSRQHHARLHANNDTHVYVSMLDNALGADAQPASAQWSRALQILLRLDTEPMTAEIVSIIDHPKQEFAFRRGSHQLLSNRNAFVGWSEQALLSEHAEDGEILLQAELVARELGTYRAFKHRWTASPDYPPDIYSTTITSNGETNTRIYMSWNGATEVTDWRIFKTDEDGIRTSHLATIPRAGFETSVEVPGYARYVFAQAMGVYGAALDSGNTEIFETNTDDGVTSKAKADEEAWLGKESAAKAGGTTLVEVPDPMGHSPGIYIPTEEDADEQHFMDTFADHLLGKDTRLYIVENPIITAVGGVMAACSFFLIGLFASRFGMFNILRGLKRGIRWSKGPRYSKIAADDAAEHGERGLDDLTPRKYGQVADHRETFKVGDDEDDELDDSKTASSSRDSGG